MSENINLREIRKYFEVGCLCIQEGSLAPMPVDAPDEEAVDYYIEHCQCSRNVKDDDERLKGLDIDPSEY